MACTDVLATWVPPRKLQAAASYSDLDHVLHAFEHRKSVAGVA